MAALPQSLSIDDCHSDSHWHTNADRVSGRAGGHTQVRKRSTHVRSGVQNAAMFGSSHNASAIPLLYDTPPIWFSSLAPHFVNTLRVCMLQTAMGAPEVALINSFQTFQTPNAAEGFVG